MCLAMRDSYGMQAAQRQGTVSPEIARQTDGVLLAVGSLSSVLKKKVGSQATTKRNSPLRAFLFCTSSHAAALACCL